MDANLRLYLVIFHRKRKKVRPEGFEPSTFGTGIQRSIHLNYGRAVEIRREIEFIM
jgi:hypothetical protein